MDRRCKYASKPCSNPRSLKDNGDLHILCDYHRDKANEAQRRWYLRNNSDGKTTPSSHARTVRRNVKAPRKVTGPQNVTFFKPPPRKRGSVTFRDNAVRAVVLSATHSVSQSTSVLPFEPIYDQGTWAATPMLEPHQVPCSWMHSSLKLPAAADYASPIQAPLESPNDVVLLSLFYGSDMTIDSSSSF